MLKNLGKYCYTKLLMTNSAYIKLPRDTDEQQVVFIEPNVGYIVGVMLDFIGLLFKEFKNCCFAVIYFVSMLCGRKFVSLYWNRKWDAVISMDFKSLTDIYYLIISRTEELVRNIYLKRSRIQIYTQRDNSRGRQIISISRTKKLFSLWKEVFDCSRAKTSSMTLSHAGNLKLYKS